MNWKKISPLLLLIFLHFLLLTQLTFTVWPEMILYPYFLLHGFSLYKDIINPYFPLLPITAFEFFKILGLSILNLKLLTWLIILFADLSVLFAAIKFYPQKYKQLIALFFYILLQIYFGGNGLWFELMLTPFILLSLTLIYFNPENLKKILLAAILFSTAILIKQNSFLFLIPIGLFLINNKKFKYLFVFISIQFLSLLICLILLKYFGIGNDFLIWAVQLPLSFSKQNGFILLPALRQYPLIIFPLVVLIPFWLNKKIKLTQKFFWILSFLIALQFAFPRYENFHLQVLVALSSIFVPMMPKKYLIFFAGTVGILFSIFFVKNFHQSDRFIDSDTLKLTHKIKSYPSLYILNGSDLSYFFADKIPPKPWGANFPWYFEFDNFEIRFIKSLEEQKTEYIVIGDQLGGGKYDLGNYLPAGLMDYIKYNYSETEKFESYAIWHRKLNSP